MHWQNTNEILTITLPPPSKNQYVLSYDITNLSEIVSGCDICNVNQTLFLDRRIEFNQKLGSICGQDSRA